MFGEQTVRPIKNGLKGKKLSANIYFFSSDCMGMKVVCVYPGRPKAFNEMKLMLSIYESLGFVI